MLFCCFKYCFNLNATMVKKCFNADVFIRIIKIFVKVFINTMYSFKKAKKEPVILLGNKYEQYNKESFEGR